MAGGVAFEDLRVTANSSVNGVDQNPKINNSLV
jgi:hypothetical protein